MAEILKTAKIILSKEEIDSPDPIVIKLTVDNEEGEGVTYTIKYPKGK
jgi:hypothetical protein